MKKKIISTIKAAGSLIGLLVLIFLIIVGFTYIFNDEFNASNRENNHAEESKKDSFGEKFVTIKEFKDGETIKLDIEEGCKYIFDGRNISPLAKDGKLDCNKQYIVDYKKTKKE